MTFLNQNRFRSHVVVQTLAHNSTATLSVIKDYLINKLQRESRQIEDDERKICQYRVETAHLRSEIQDLKTRCEIRKAAIPLNKIRSFYFLPLVDKFTLSCTYCEINPRLSNFVSFKCQNIPEDEV